MKAFSSEEVHKDSTMFEGQMVEHLTSWLSINPFKGCSLNCAYCFRAKWHPASKPQQIYPIIEGVKALINHPNFIPNETAVSINNSSTDPLLPGVRKGTFEALRLMEEYKLRNPFVLITKLSFSETEITFLKSLKYVRPIIFVSLAFIPKHIEPAPIKSRIKNIQKLSGTGIPLIMYFRPIVKGWNDSIGTITKALSIGQKYCHAICIGGLRLSPEIRKALLLNGESLLANIKDEFHEKYFSEEIQDKIYHVYDTLNLTIPIFKHSSCAVSLILNTHNYNLLFKNPKKNCLKTCPLHQQKKCNSYI